MRSITRHLSPGLAALAVLGIAGTAHAASPDPQPFLTTNSEAALGTPKWYVDTSRTGGAYSALYRHPVEVKNDLGNNSGAGPLEFVVTPGTATGTPTQRTAGARQVHDAVNADLAPNVTLGTTSFDGVSQFIWGVKGLISYTLTPASGSPVASNIPATCWFDGTVYTAAGCLGGSSGSGFISGIPANSGDAIALSSNGPAIDVTSVAPGDGSITAAINPAVVDIDPTNNSVSVPLKVPGVVAAPVAATTTTATPKAIALTANIVAPEVLGRRLDAAGPPTPAPADGSRTYSIASNPANGALSGLNTATGAVTYTARAGFTGADSFTYYAEDSRGIRSAATTVSVNVTAAPGGATGGGGTTLPPPGTIGKITLKLTPAYAVVKRGSKTFLKVSGKLPVSQAGRTIKIQRKVGKRVTTIATVRIATNGKFSKLVRVSTRTVSVRATIAASATAKASTSAFRSVLIRR